MDQLSSICIYANEYPLMDVSYVMSLTVDYRPVIIIGIAKVKDTKDTSIWLKIPIQGIKWQTTECYIKGEAIRRLLSVILFIFYILIFIGEIVWWTSNVRNWRKCYRLVQYLPIESASNFVRDNTITDLHLILAMVELNGSRQKVSHTNIRKRITWLLDIS